MLNTLKLRTLNETAYINGMIIYDDLGEMLIHMLRSNADYDITISNEPFTNSDMAMSLGVVGNARTYRCPNGTFTVCTKELQKLQIGKTFYYKINKY